MARTINADKHSSKRNAILATARRLVLVKGYERMSIGDILETLNISSGAFYHYFDSKPAVLEALIDTIRHESSGPLQAVVDDPSLTGAEKVQGFLDVLEHLRREQQQAILAILKVWYADHNAIVRQKVEAAVRTARVPMLASIVAQGKREGAFAVPDAARAGEVVSSLLEGMGGHHAELILAFPAHLDERRFRDGVIGVHAAYMEAIERVLHAPANMLRRIGDADLAEWVVALRRT